MVSESAAEQYTVAVILNHRISNKPGQAKRNCKTKGNDKEHATTKSNLQPTIKLSMIVSVGKPSKRSLIFTKRTSLWTERNNITANKNNEGILILVS